MIVNEALNTRSNYFVVPNAIYNLGLSSGAVATYGYLSACENRNRNSSDRYTCYPSMTTIGRAIGRDRKTVAKYVDELVEAGLILTEPTKVTTADGMRWNGNLKYTLLDPQRAVELHHERQFARNDAHLETGVRKKRKAMKKVEKKRQRKQKPHDEYVAKRSAHAPEGLPCWDVNRGDGAPRCRVFTRTKGKAGESPAAFCAAGRSHQPAVRAVLGTEAGAFSVRRNCQKRFCFRERRNPAFLRDSKRS